MPQPYGFNNLNRQSLFLADGTERSYYALPENYPLERVVPEWVFAVYDESDGCLDSVHVFTGTPEQLTYEEEKCNSRQVPKCLSKPTFSPERPTVGTEGVFSFTNEKESDNELLAVSFNNASDNAFTEDATDFAYPRAPAIHADRYIKLTNKKSTQVVSILCVQEATMHCDDERFAINIKKQDVLIYKHGITYPCDLNTNKEVPFALQYQLPLSSAPCTWDPGIDLFSYRKLHLFSWIPPSAIFILQQLHNKNISSMWECSLEKGRQVQWDPGIEISSYMYIWPEMRAVKTLTWLKIHSELQYHLQMSKTFSVWDPGILRQMDMMLGKTAVTNLVHSGQIPCKLLNFIGQPVDLKQFWAQLLLQSRSWYNTPNVCLQVQYCCLQIVLACPYSEPVQQLVCYSRMFSSTEAILSAICMSTATTLRLILVLSSGEIAQEGRDGQLAYMFQGTSIHSPEWVRHMVTVLSCWFPSFEMAELQWDPRIGTPSSIYLWLQGLTARIATEKPLSWLPIPELTKWQSHVTSASFVWDPGTMLLWYKSKWWLLFTEEKINWHNDIKCYGVALWLIHFQPP